MTIAGDFSDNLTGAFPCPATLAIARGDLMWWDNVNKVQKPANQRADTGSLLGNQADFAPLFLGVSEDQRLASETSTGNDSRRVTRLDTVKFADCPSQTWEIGDYVGIDRSTVPANFNQQVNKVSTRRLAIGICARREPVAVTKVLVRFQSALILDLSAGGSFGISGLAPETLALADASQSLALSSAQRLTMTPTVARTVNLPPEALADGINQEFLFVNLSTNVTVTFQSSTGGTIKGNGAVPGGKSGYFFTVNDGTNPAAWVGQVSS